MQSATEIQESVFQDAKKIVEKLMSQSTAKALANSEKDILKLQELAAFLRISIQYSSGQEEKDHKNVKELPDGETDFENHTEKYHAEEEVIFNNKLNQIDQSEIDHPEYDENLEEEAVFNNELNEIEEILSEDEENEEIQLAVEESEPNENRGKIVEISKQERLQQLNEVAEELQELHHEEKKIRLANIKGLKKIQSLFDDELTPEEDPKPESSSLLKTNVPVDFMEAGKPKAEFKLDLNDKIAFSKMLFEGSQSEMNETIHQLNSFSTLEEAKEFLSDIYYRKGWEKADEYAQRLWSLVENKFQ